MLIGDSQSPRPAVFVLLGGTCLGALLLATHPFGVLPPGPAHGNLGPALNGLILAVTPVAALFVFYWRTLHTAYPRVGIHRGSRVAGGPVPIAVFGSLLALVPFAAYARGYVAAGIAVSASSTALIGGFVEIQRRMRIASAPDGDFLGPVVQWDALWLGCWAVVVLAALSAATTVTAWRPLLVLAIGLTPIATYLSTITALSDMRDWTGVLALACWLGGAGVAIAVPTRAIALFYGVGVVVAVVIVERHRRKAEAARRGGPVVRGLAR